MSIQLTPTIKAALTALSFTWKELDMPADEKAEMGPLWSATIIDNASHHGHDLFIHCSARIGHDPILGISWELDIRNHWGTELHVDSLNDRNDFDSVEAAMCHIDLRLNAFVVSTLVNLRYRPFRAIT